MGAPGEQPDDGLSGVPPNQTLYVRNLNEKLHIVKLKEALYTGFSQFGSVLDVVAKKTYKLRGQAWIVFENIESATRARKELNGYTFHGKSMDVQFAKGKSDAIAKLDGTYKPRPKRKRAEPAHGASKPAKQQSSTSGNSSKKASTASSAVNEEAPAPPNKVLFAQNLPDECNHMMLQMLFQQYTGFVEVRLVSGKGVAFIEFNDETNAGVALQGLRGFKLKPTVLMQLSYAKK